MKRGGDADALKLESASRRTQDSHKDCHKVKHRDSHQSHQSQRHIDTNRRPLAPLLSTSNTVEAPMRDGGDAVTHGSHSSSLHEPAPTCPVAA